MYRDFKELLSVLNEDRAKYLVVGAYAVSVYAQPRATAADFAEPGPFFRMGREPVSVDILTKIPGVDFDAAWMRRVEAVVDTASGLKASFISAEDLVAAELATARPQDLADVDAVRKAAQSQAAARPAPPRTSGPKR